MGPLFVRQLGDNLKYKLWILDRFSYTQCLNLVTDLVWAIILHKHCCSDTFMCGQNRSGQLYHETEQVWPVLS